MTFQEYLVSKKIDAKAFSAAEPAVFAAWELEFGQMHPNSFTVQKLNLINPIRRKYLLPAQEAPSASAKTEVLKTESTTEAPSATSPSAPKVPRPMFKPKPKTN